MNKEKLISRYNLITNTIILSLLIFGSLAWADSNGVWTLAGDIRGGIFGNDEQPQGGYSFINPVTFNEKVDINDNLSVLGDVRIYGGIHIGTNSLVYDDSSGVLSVGKLKLTGGPSDCLIYSNVSGDFECSGLIGVGDIDTSQIQARISDNSCSSAGLSIKTINSDGGVVCEFDNIDDADSNPVNEIQGLTISGHTITLSSGGGTVVVPDNVNDADYNIGNEYPVAGTGIIVSGRTVSVNTGVIATKSYVDSKVSSSGGLSGYEIKTASVVSGGSWTYVTATCSSGKVVLGGGCSTVHAMQNFDNPVGNNAWKCGTYNNNASTT